MSADRSSLILLVDDHADTLEMYRVRLTAAGHRVTVASNGEEALAHAAHDTPAVVITDIRMPGRISALDLCRHFQRMNVPVIALTALTPTSPEFQEIQRAGCAAVLVKPAFPDDVAGEVQRVLSAPQATQ